MAALDGITAAILVGGLGTRLRSVVSDVPKPLAPVNGRPFLYYLFDQLVMSGVSSVVLCTGHRGELVRDLVGREYCGLTFEYSQENTPLGTGGALRQAAPLIRSNPFFVLNGDSYCLVDLGQMFDEYRRQSAEVAILLAHSADTSAFGRVELDRGGRIVRFCEKGTDAGPGLINAGVYLISQARLSSIPKGRPVSLEREIFPTWVEQGMLGWNGCQRFIDIGTPQSLRAAGEFFKGLPPN